MPFAAELLESLQLRERQVPAEFINGDDLEQVLNRHLLNVEAMAEGELITSILLLSADGKRLSHGAAPGLPQSYCNAIDGSEIGPCAGSCGTAAFLGQPIYVSDIATNPLWENYRHLALPHRLRSCWSTPIREPDGAVIGTFAIYRRTAGNPTADEVEAIQMITEHVAQAIILARHVQDLERPHHSRPYLTVVEDDEWQSPLFEGRRSRLLSLAARLQAKVAELEGMAENAESRETAETFKETAQLSQKLVEAIRSEADELGWTPDR